MKHRWRLGKAPSVYGKHAKDTEEQHYKPFMD